jgi:hypothetical protein
MSWKTTVLGILALIAAVSQGGIAFLDGDPSTSVNFETIGLAIMGLIGLFTRDNDKTSEDVKAGRKK